MLLDVKDLLILLGRANSLTLEIYYGWLGFLGKMLSTNYTQIW